MRRGPLASQAVMVTWAPRAVRLGVEVCRAGGVGAAAAGEDEVADVVPGDQVAG